MITLRDDWDDIKVDIMQALVILKFNDNELANMLLKTNDSELIEGNHWNDRFWGECPIGTGQNQLGKILMNTRELLIENRLPDKYSCYERLSEIDYKPSPLFEDI